MVQKIVFVLGAGIEGSGSKAQPDRESMYALMTAAKQSRMHQCPVIALPGWSEKYQVHFGKLLVDTLFGMKNHSRTGPYDIIDPDDDEYATEFSTKGEVRAFWRYLERRFKNEKLAIYVVARGLHSYRAAFLTWLLCPKNRRRKTNIIRVQAPLKEPQFFYSLKSWTMLVYKKLFRKL